MSCDDRNTIPVVEEIRKRARESRQKRRMEMTLWFIHEDKSLLVDGVYELCDR